ncbi:MAG: hypothetical protein AB7K71_02030 [Polyangiaceae bacterium]
MEDKPETAQRPRVPNTLETLRLEPEHAQRLAMESTSDALPTNPLGQAVPRPEAPLVALGKDASAAPGSAAPTSESPTRRPPPATERGAASPATRPPPRPRAAATIQPPSQRSTVTPSVSPLQGLLDGNAGEWREVPSEPKIRVEDEATRPDLRAIRRPIRIARDGGFDEDQPTQPARHLGGRGPRTPKEREHAADPRMLLVGFPEGLELAVTDGLKRQSIRVVVGSPLVLSQALLERVDYLVLFGDPRGNDVQRLLGRVSKLHLPALNGVLLVSDDMTLAARVLALRHGATSVIPRSASVGLLVERIAHVAWGTELSDERACEREATVEELVGTFAEELENRLRAPGESSDPRGATRLVFSAARELPRLIDDMVQRVGVDIERVEHWDYELSARGSRAWLEDETQPLGGARVALLDDDAMRADAVAHELRERGAHVLVVGSQLTELAWSRLARFDPMLLVFDSAKDAGWRTALQQRQAADPSLHQATRGAVDLSLLWQVSESFPNIEPVTRELGRVTQRLRGAADRLRAGELLEVAELGISVRHLLRCLASDAGCRLELQAGDRRLRVWLADGVVIGATEVRVGVDEERVGEGLAALTELLACRQAQLGLMPAPPSSGPPNLITPVDVALGQALSELRLSAGVVTPGAVGSPAAVGATARAAEGQDGQVTPPGLVVLPAVPARSTPPHPQTQAPLSGEPWLQPSSVLRPPIDPLGVQRKPGTRGWVWLSAALLSVGVAAGGMVWWQHAGRLAEPMKARVEVSNQGIAAVRQEERYEVEPSSTAASAPTPPPEVAKPKRAGLGLTEQLSEARAATFTVRGQPVPDCGSEAPVGTPGLAIAKARRALMSGKLAAATDAYCAALALQPEDAQLMTELARVFLQRGAGEQAVKWAKRAYELAPKTLNQVLLGDALALDGRNEDARRAWSEAWNIKASATLAAIASAHFHTATSAAGQRDYAKAERFMRRVIVLDPERADAPLALARVLLEASPKLPEPRFKEAQAWALRAVALTKRAEDPDAWSRGLEVLRDAARSNQQPELAAAAAQLSSAP